MLEKIKQTADFIKNIIQETPDFAIVLGSGLGNCRMKWKLFIFRIQRNPQFSADYSCRTYGKLIYGILEGKKY
jgi:purine-nucleoside phosphorylase